MNEQELLSRLGQVPQPKSHAELAELLQSLYPELAEQTHPVYSVTSEEVTLPNFDLDIPYKKITFTDWSQTITLGSVGVFQPQTPEDVKALANWAKDKKCKLRASGHSHNWSPLVVTSNENVNDLFLVDTSLLNKVVGFDQANLTVTFQTGITIEDATAFLESLDNEGRSKADGYSWQNFTGPGAMSLGGVLAIGGHGTSLPYDGHLQPLAGCLSNLVVSFKAVVTDPNGSDPDFYDIKEFHRSDTDSAAFLVHLGRAFLTEVTMKVIPNYYLKLVNRYPQAEDLFQDHQNPLKDDAISNLLNSYGRVEVIWFPFTSQPWVKTWEIIEDIDPHQPQTDHPYNIPVVNDVSLGLSNKIKWTLQHHLLPTTWFCEGQLSIVKLAVPENSILQGKSRDLLLYVEDSTLRVTSWGYAIQIRRDQVQETAHLFYSQYKSLLDQYEGDKYFWSDHPCGKYPINSAVEMRWTTIDVVGDLGLGEEVQPPALSVCHAVDPTLDTVFWVDVLTLPGTEYSSNFFVDLETWATGLWGTAAKNVMRPEWSKGWAYTKANGAWTNTEIMNKDIPDHYNQVNVEGVGSFTWAKETLAKYDRFNIYSNKFLDQLLPG